MVNNTNIKIYKDVNITASYTDTFSFRNRIEQQAYFDSKIFLNLNNYSYQRKNNSIQVAYNVNALDGITYLSFDNNGRTFYCFINNVFFVNENNSVIEFSIDIIQTYFLDTSFKTCFVEREHVQDDRRYHNLVDENLATTKYTSTTVSQKIYRDWVIVIASSVNLNDIPAFSDIAGTIYGKIFSGLAMFMYKDWDTASDALINLSEQGKSNAVSNIYMIPRELVGSNWGEGEFLPNEVPAPSYFNLPTTNNLNGYVPKNNKMFNYPYHFCLMSNQSGLSNVLKYELFSSTPKVQLVGGTQASAKILAYPYLYQGVLRNLNEGISTGDFPQCAWTNNVYNNWFAVNSIKQGYAVADLENKQFSDRPVASSFDRLIGANDHQSNPVLSTLTNILSSGAHMAEGLNYKVPFKADYERQSLQNSFNSAREVADIQPPAIKGTVGNSYSNIQRDEYGFFFECRTLLYDEAKKIDDYFSVYGYKVDEIKVPNIFSRRSWNYIKTTKVNMRGNIPSSVMRQLKDILNNGITFWHNKDIGNYALDNSIV